MSGWHLAGEWTAVDCPEYLLDIDEYRDGDKQMVFVHLLVRKWSKSALQRLKRDWALFRQCVPGPVFTYGMVEDAKFERFVSHFGWEPFTTIPCTDGTTRRLYLHNNNKKSANVFQIKRNAAAVK